MLNLSISAEVENFRTEFKSWLSAQSVPQSKSDSSLDTFVKAGRSWQQMMAKGAWIGVHWPKEFGGRGLSLVEEAIVQEELVRASAPQILGLFGLTMVGPVLIQHGTPAQKSRYLAKILDASEIWCQGFSEPGAGSDLAAITTRAEPDGSGFRVTGQKIWTSFAQIADWCFVLARTSQEAEKHQGLSYLLIDMRSPGVTTKPLKQISGDAEFNEVFFDSVPVPAENVVGQVGEGWKIAISTLMYERVVLTFARQLQSEVALRSLLAEARNSKASGELRRELADAVVEACAVRALAYEHLLTYASGKRPGPEGSLDKLFWSESFQKIAELGVKLSGRQAALGETDPVQAANMHRYLYSRGRTIAAGTSEIQKNIIAERVLGLPRLKFSS